MPNETNDVSYDYAIHSDFLIHWTGKKGDIDTSHDWYDNSDKSKTTSEETERYLERFHDILKYGFWMTYDTQSYPDLRLPKAPKVAQTCFTELKLSQARKHAKKYGRLGIGVKRYFLFKRGGRPVIYHNFGRGHVIDPFYESCCQIDPYLLNYFKPMNSATTLNYDLYAESEWRILCTERDLQAVKAERPEKQSRYFQQLDKAQQERLKYLLPIDDWLGLIIYPSLEVKRQTYTYKNGAIRELIERIVKNQSPPENGVWPIEVSLDACRNF